jgi:hypothetical protein
MWVPEAQLEVTGLSDAALPQHRSAPLEAFPPERLEEQVLRGLQLRRIGKPRGVDDRLGGAEGLLVERDDAPDEVVDKAVEFGVRDCAIDPTLALRRIGIEIVLAEDDLERASSADQDRESLKGTASGDQPRVDFGLAKDRLLAAREAEVEAQRELGAAPADSPTNHGDAQHAALREPPR